MDIRIKQVLLKIIKHCQDYTDADIATGVLLGMDLEDENRREVNLEVGNGAVNYLSCSTRVSTVF